MDTSEENPIRGSPRRLELVVRPRFMKKEGMGMTKTANAMSRHAAKVNKDYLRHEITIHESNFREENQYWPFANGFMHAKNGLGLVKPHVMGACILTFESINKDNPLATNQTIAMIANVFGNVHAPIDISCSISNFFQNMDCNVQHFSNAI